MSVARARVENESSAGPTCRRRGVVALDEERFDRARFGEHPLQDDEQRHQVASRNPSMNQRLESRPLARWIEAADELRRMRTHHRQQRFDRLQHAGHAAKRERSGAEADDFPVRRRLESSDDVYGIGGGGDVIERAIQIVEPLARVRSRDRLAIRRERHDFPAATR